MYAPMPAIVYWASESCPVKPVRTVNDSNTTAYVNVDAIASTQPTDTHEISPITTRLTTASGSRRQLSRAHTRQPGRSFASLREAAGRACTSTAISDEERSGLRPSGLGHVVGHLGFGDTDREAPTRA